MINRRSINKGECMNKFVEMWNKKLTNMIHVYVCKYDSGLKNQQYNNYKACNKKNNEINIDSTFEYKLHWYFVDFLLKLLI